MVNQMLTLKIPIHICVCLMGIMPTFRFVI